MREKLQTLPMTELREIAKANGIKSVTTMRKAVLIDKIIEVTGTSSETGTETSASATAIPGYSVTTVAQEHVAHPPAYTEPSPRIQAYSSMDASPRQQSYTQSQNESSPRVQYSSGDSMVRQPYTASAYTSSYEPRQRSYDRGNDRPVRSYDRSYDRSQDRSYDRSQDRTYERPQNRSYDRSQDRTYDRSQDRTYERPQDRTYDRSQDRTYERPQDRSYDMTQDRTYTRSYERPSFDRTPSNTDDMSFDPNLDSGIEAHGILEVMPDGFGFIRCENYLPGDNDIYVSPVQIRKFNLKTGDIILGKVKVKTPTEKFAALLYITTVNGYPINEVLTRPSFEDLTPVFPNEKIKMETDEHNMAMRILDIVSPIGKGQRGMIVSPPKAGKTTLLKEIARSITVNNPEMHMIILLIDERPEEVTDIKEAIEGDNVEVIYSTFDELPEHHKRVSEMVIERGKRLVEHGKDVVILLDSITRLARAYNLIVPPSGRTLSGGLDPAALHMPKKFFGAARNMREKGSLTILATALVETGSKMDDVVFEEFKGTGNMELVLNRKLSEKRVFPAIDILKSGTRRDDLLLSDEEMAAADIIKKASGNMKPDDSVESILNFFAKTKDNAEFCQTIIKQNL